MPKKGADRRLLLRKAIKDRSAATTSIAKGPFKFTKTEVGKIESPPKGQRHTYRDTLNKRLCLRVTPTAKTFYWEKTVKGSQKRVTIGRFPEINVEQARVLAADIAADYAKGIDVQEKRAALREESTLGELWLAYREHRKEIKGKESDTLNYQWKRYFKKWEDQQLSEISKAKAQRMILNIRKTAKFHGNRIHAHGKAMFNYAINELEWEGKNPFRFKMVGEKGRERSKVIGARLLPHQMPNFIEGLEACSEGMRVLFLTTLYTGRRVGEVQAMRWGDLDLKAGLWSLTETKTEPQIAGLPNAIVDLLVERKKDAISEWVFPSPSKSGHVQEIKKAWATVRKVSGLHDLQARDLRRTFISWAQEAGVPIAAVQVQVGHANIATTAKSYTAFSDTEKKKALHETVSSMIEAANSSKNSGSGSD